MVNVAMLIGYVILYVIPGVLALSAAIRLCTARDYNKKLTSSIILVIVCSFWGYLMFSYYSGENKAEKAQIRICQLTAYPNCHPCELELKENKTFVVRQNKSIREIGTWHFESGQDYWITYLNEYGQLGTGKYSYQESHLKDGY
jgi:hypothetical protein